MIKFDLGILGEHSPVTPSSLSVIFELVTAWSEEPNRTDLGFICAAAIVLSIETAQKPKHKITRPIKDYGRECIEYLLSNGVPIPQIYSYGSYVLGKAIQRLPMSAGVEEKADFLSQPVEDNSNISD